MSFNLLSPSDLLGTLGVFQILLAYFLNLYGKLKTTHKYYLFLNLFGALLACLSSFLINSIPFIILEGTWAVVSALAIFNKNNPVIKNK